MLPFGLHLDLSAVVIIHAIVLGTKRAVAAEAWARM